MMIIYQLFRDSLKEYFKDKCPQLGAALAFYVVFSLAPLLLVVIGTTGLVLGESAARGQVVAQFEELAGADGARQVESLLAAEHRRSTSLLSTLVGLVALLVGSTGLFAHLQTSLNVVWNVPPKPSDESTLRMIRTEVVNRLWSFSLVGALAFLLFASLILAALTTILGDWLTGTIGDSAIPIQVANVLISIVLATVLFALIFKVLPDKHIAWRAVWVGALATSLLFNVGKYLIGLYLGYAAVGSSFGAAGSLVALLTWVYYSSQLLLLGAEFTQVYAARFHPGTVSDSRVIVSYSNP